MWSLQKGQIDIENILLEKERLCDINKQDNVSIVFLLCEWIYIYI